MYEEGDGADDCEIGGVFEDAIGGKWLKLSESRFVRLISGEELEKCRQMPDDEVH